MLCRLCILFVFALALQSCGRSRGRCGEAYAKPHGVNGSSKMPRALSYSDSVGYAELPQSLNALCAYREISASCHTSDVVQWQMRCERVLAHSYAQRWPQSVMPENARAHAMLSYVEELADGLPSSNAHQRSRFWLKGCCSAWRGADLSRAMTYSVPEIRREREEWRGLFVAIRNFCLSYVDMAYAGGSCCATTERRVVYELLNAREADLCRLRFATFGQGRCMREIEDAEAGLMAALAHNVSQVDRESLDPSSHDIYSDMIADMHAAATAVDNWMAARRCLDCRQHSDNAMYTRSALQLLDDIAAVVEHANEPVGDLSADEELQTSFCTR